MRLPLAKLLIIVCTTKTGLGVREDVRCAISPVKPKQVVDDVLSVEGERAFGVVGGCLLPFLWSLRRSRFVSGNLGEWSSTLLLDVALYVHFDMFEWDAEFGVEEGGSSLF